MGYLKHALQILLYCVGVIMSETLVKFFEVNLCLVTMVSASLRCRSIVWLHSMTMLFISCTMPPVHVIWLLVYFSAYYLHASKMHENIWSAIHVECTNIYENDMKWKHECLTEQWGHVWIYIKTCILYQRVLERTLNDVSLWSYANYAFMKFAAQFIVAP